MNPPTVAEARAMSPRLEEVPEGWFSREQLETAWNLGAAQTGRLIRDAVRNGKAEVRKFRIQTVLRGLYPTEHYKF